AAGDAMAGLKLGDVGRQGLRVAGDVQDAVVTLDQFQGARIQASPGRVDEDGAELIAAQVDTLQSTELAYAGQRLGYLFTCQAHQSDILYLIVSDVLQRRAYRALGQLCGQYPAKAGRPGQGEVAVTAAQLQQVISSVPGRVQRLAEHTRVDHAVGLGEATLDRLVTPGAATHLQLFDRMIARQHPA